MSSKTTSERIRVRRVTLPRYEVQYGSPDHALTHAQSIKSEKLFSLEEQLVDPVGQEVVLDMRVDDVVITTTLLFRIIQSMEAATVLEWWPRRKSDPDLLELWIEGLSQGRQADPSNSQDAVAQAELMQIHQLCRRALAGNPFVALDIHWTAMWTEVETACQDSINQLLRFKNSPRCDSKLEGYILKARDGLIAARSSLSSLEKRQLLRSKFATKEELEHARNQARHRAEAARQRGESERWEQAGEQLRELLF